MENGFPDKSDLINQRQLIEYIEVLIRNAIEESSEIHILMHYLRSQRIKTALHLHLRILTEPIPIQNTDEHARQHDPVDFTQHDIAWMKQIGIRMSERNEPTSLP